MLVVRLSDIEQGVIAIDRMLTIHLINAEILIRVEIGINRVVPFILFPIEMK
jgi:hypothetical protein